MATEISYGHHYNIHDKATKSMLQIIEGELQSMTTAMRSTIALLTDKIKQGKKSLYIFHFDRTNYEQERKESPWFVGAEHLCYAPFVG